MKSLFIFIFCFQFLAAFSQPELQPPPPSTGTSHYSYGIDAPALQAPDTSKKSQIAQDEVFVVVEQMPEFPGGEAALYKFINDNLVYPVQAKEMGMEGKVICSFVVDKKGKIKNIEILRGIGYGCDKEAIRIIGKMPNWKPGKQNGRPVNVKFILPIIFQLKE